MKTLSLTEFFGVPENEKFESFGNTYVIENGRLYKIQFNSSKSLSETSINNFIGAEVKKLPKYSQKTIEEAKAALLLGCNWVHNDGKTVYLIWRRPYSNGGPGFNTYELMIPNDRFQEVKGSMILSDIVGDS